ncbi:MAG: hypothetical protein WCA49_25405 [Candidatus Sulfotelmatobacter sp.]
MKLIIREYLASLRERGELDAILPDLLSQLGLNVYSRPARGTRQDGVDVGAVGSLSGGAEKVYLFCIKAGDLTRKEWGGDAVQSLRPSLNEILDAYIPNRIPVEHRGKEVAICITIGGDVQEQVRPDLTGFISQNTTPTVSFEEWNGDRLASLIESSFLREDLLPSGARPQLRKALALLDEPDAAYRHFAALLQLLSGATGKSADRVRAIRQISICLWILFGWARESKNMEAVYRSGELAVLHAWNILREFAGTDNRATDASLTAFHSVFQAYQEISAQFLSTVLPHVNKLHGLSSAVRGSSGLDVNLKMFDLLGRMAVAGLWSYWGATLFAEGEQKERNEAFAEVASHALSVKALISNNPVLLMPAKDSQVTDISIALLLLVLNKNDHASIRNWLGEMSDRATFALSINGQYPCILESYSDLLVHPKPGDAEYRKNVTSASVLYPAIAMFAAFVGDGDTYDKVANLRKEHLPHCNFQLWYPDDNSEDRLYTNRDSHGATLSDLRVNLPKEEFLKQVFTECEHSPQLFQLSAFVLHYWPIIIVACRHYCLPLPIHFLKIVQEPKGATGAGENEGRPSPAGQPPETFPQPQCDI